VAAGVLIVTLISLIGGRAWYQRATIDELVGKPLAAGHPAEAKVALRSWTESHADSADAQFYRAWLAFLDNDAATAADAIDRCEKLQLDSGRLQVLSAIFGSRTGKYNLVESILVRAYQQQVEPRALVARELARMYLETYRLSQATEPIEVWKSLAPDDPQPYMWAIEITSRSEHEPEALIKNYRAALDRKPDLDAARLGLAQQLTKARQFEEAEREFQKYLEHKPKDAVAYVGLGRNAMQAGDLDNATRHFEAALEADPRNTDSLKELALADLRENKAAKACERYKLLVELVPFDYEIRYAYAQALRLAGNQPEALEQSKQASRLRKDDDRIKEIREQVIKNPNDMDTRFAAAQWMFEHGHEEEGLSWTNEVLRIAPKHAATHRLLEGYYQKRGNVGLANYHRMMLDAQTGAAADTARKALP
jgi:tetratricopeptide (TPR) repeat protein